MDREAVFIRGAFGVLFGFFTGSVIGGCEGEDLSDSVVGAHLEVFWE